MARTRGFEIGNCYVYEGKLRLSSWKLEDKKSSMSFGSMTVEDLHYLSSVLQEYLSKVDVRQERVRILKHRKF